MFKPLTCSALTRAVSDDLPRVIKAPVIPSISRHRPGQVRGVPRIASNLATLRRLNAKEPSN